MKKYLNKNISIILIFLFSISCTKKEQLAKLPADNNDTKASRDFAQDSYKTPMDPSIQLQGEKAQGIPGEKPRTSAITSILPSTNLLNKSSEVSINTLVATVNGVETSQLAFRVDGYIIEVLVKNGQYVKKGQVVARLDDNIAREQLNLAKYALDQAKTNQYFSELTLKRTQTLNLRQATTQIALEQAQAGAQNSLIAYKTASANLKLAQINFDQTILTAPYDGYLFNITTWVGNYVSSTTTVATITSVNDLEIKIPIPQTITNNFKIGQEFSFSNTSQNISGNLKITGIVPYVDEITKTYLLFGKPEKVRGQLMAGELVVIELK